MQYVVADLAHAGYALPSTGCALNPSGSAFDSVDQVKENVGLEHWRCKACGKEFISEHFVDKHALRYHQDLSLNASSDAHCLADLCDLLHCDALQSTIMSDDAERVLADEHAALGTLGHSRLPCDERCMALRRRQCDAVRVKCFTVPPSFASHAGAVQAFRQAAANFDDNFCKRIGTLVDRSGLADAVAAAVPLRRATGSFVPGLWFVLVLVVGMLVVYAYGMLYLWQADRVRVSEMRPTTRAQPSAWQRMVRAASVVFKAKRL